MTRLRRILTAILARLEPPHRIRARAEGHAQARRTAGRPW